MFISIYIKCFSHFNSRIFPQTEVKAPPQVTEFIKSIERYPYCMNIDKF